MNSLSFVKIKFSWLTIALALVNSALVSTDGCNIQESQFKILAPAERYLFACNKFWNYFCQTFLQTLLWSNAVHWVGPSAILAKGKYLCMF